MAIAKRVPRPISNREIPSAMGRQTVTNLPPSTALDLLLTAEAQATAPFLGGCARPVGKYDCAVTLPAH